MKIITVFNQKGGAGKTTVAMLLADELNERGFRVLVADTDPQASAHKWSVRTLEGYDPFPVRVDWLSRLSRQQLSQQLAQRADGLDFIILDTPPNLESRELDASLFVADLALLPYAPNAAHNDALEEVQPLVAKVQEERDRQGAGGLPVRLVLNKLDTRRGSQRTLAQNLSNFAAFPALSATLGNRAAYENAWNYRTALSALARPSDPARVEVKRLADELLEELP